MAIPKTAPRTVILVGKELCTMKELVAGGTITPGHLVSIASTGKYVVHPTAKGRTPAIFAAEADLVGKGIDDNYVANDNVYAWACPAGVEVNALVAAAAAAIVIGDKLESAGDGTLRKVTAESQLTSGNYTYTSAGNVIATALEALDNSGGGSAARLKVLIG